MTHIQKIINKCIVTKMDTFHLPDCSRPSKCKASTIKSIILDKIKIDLSVLKIISDARTQTGHQITIVRFTWQ